MKDDTKAFSEFRRVLKPGGILIIKVPAFNWLRGKHDDIVQTKRRYNKQELQNKLINAEFKIMKISYNNMFLLPIVFAKRWLDNRDATPSQSDIGPVNPVINWLFVLIGAFEIKLLTFLNLPFGVSIIAVTQKVNTRGWGDFG